MPTKPSIGERKPEFIQRCVKEMIDAGHDPNQATAACYTMWDQNKGLKRYSKLKSFVRFF